MKATAHELRLQRRYQRLQREWLQLRRRLPRADPDNIWHTLVSLQMPPIERLRIGLLRAQRKHLSKV